MAAAPDAPRPVTVGHDDDATILYTSGSTGTPKGAVSTQSAVLSGLKCWTAYFGALRGLTEAAMAAEFEVPSLDAALEAAGVRAPVSIILDAAVATAMESVDMVIVGAEGVLEATALVTFAVSSMPSGGGSAPGGRSGSSSPSWSCGNFRCWQRTTWVRTENRPLLTVAERRS